jgi:hypothetical protein
MSSYFFAHEYHVSKTCMQNAPVKKMKYFHIILHTYIVNYKCFKHTIFMCKKYKLMKILFLHYFHYQIVR